MSQAKRNRKNSEIAAARARRERLITIAMAAVIVGVAIAAGSKAFDLFPAGVLP